jgi:hypothetical protein
MSKASGLNPQKSLNLAFVELWHSRCYSLRQSLPKSLSKQAFQAKLDKWFTELAGEISQMADTHTRLELAAEARRLQEWEAQLNKDELDIDMRVFRERLAQWDAPILTADISRKLRSFLHEDKYQDEATKAKARGLFIELTPLMDMAEAAEKTRKKERPRSKKRKAASRETEV